MEALIMVGQLILGLTILVGLHELGHMLSAKWFGMRVEKYAIGFPPKILSKQIGETEYMIGAVPLGGFVKISGMIDESMDTATMAEPPKPYEFRSKPAWQRLIVMMGGIIVNVITGIFIFIFLIYIYGESYLSISEAKYGIVVNEDGRKMGLRDGDKIVKVNGKTIKEFEEIYDIDALMGSNSYYTVNRNGQLVDVKIPANLIETISAPKNKQRQQRFAEPRIPFTVARVEKNTAAAKAKLQPGDRIVQIDNQPIHYFHELQAALAARAEKPVTLGIQRGNQFLTAKTTIEKEGTLGFYPNILINYNTRYFSFLNSIPKGTEQAFSVLVTHMKGLKKLVSGEMSSKSLGGPIMIAQTYGSTFDWFKFWTLTGVLSIILAFMNFLPIPALDGGHVMFLTYEMVTGQKPSDKFLEKAQLVGMVLLIGLMIFAFGNDIYYRLLPDSLVK
ncbi:RIP metalloprotease RseP [Adhaeribacter radiodurans]|uniref:Zinc metalloprotease n=1 Tax=Adhaeribacter radiodurans TaxID=2745197 RepID=A0A7L7LAG7_9BACT|nr:RIP metalloprotease RseP [Adhaeribacter radiodurans]QMU29832.1 RIP metalloprotease RseP [Adhaeribacter radiodurans]